VDVLHARATEQVGGYGGRVPGVSGVGGEGADAGNSKQLEEGLDRFLRPPGGVIESAQFDLLADLRTGLSPARLIVEISCG
jgi:hypothetical protein